MVDIVSGKLRFKNKAMNERVLPGLGHFYTRYQEKEIQDIVFSLSFA